MKALKKFLKSYLGIDAEVVEWKVEKGLLKVHLFTQKDGNIFMNLVKNGNHFRVYSVNF